MGAVLRRACKDGRKSMGSFVTNRVCCGVARWKAALKQGIMVLFGET